MSLLRFVARTLLASYFVVNGVKAVRSPRDFSQAAQPIVDTVIPAVQAVLPERAAGYLPGDAVEVARYCGLAQIAGGISLATGAGRRFGAGLLAVSMVPQLLPSNPFKATPEDRARLSRDVALLGGVALATMDTEGEPDLAWRLRAHRQLAARRKAEQARSREVITTGTVDRARALRKRVESALS